MLKTTTDSYGTQRLNREFIPASLRTISKTDLRHGELVATYCPDLSLMVCLDSNFVSMITTYHSLQIGTSNKYNRTTYKPSIVLDYNKQMEGVDRKVNIYPPTTWKESEIVCGIKNYSAVCLTLQFLIVTSYITPNTQKCQTGSSEQY